MLVELLREENEEEEEENDEKAIKQEKKLSLLLIPAYARNISITTINACLRQWKKKNKILVILV